MPILLEDIWQSSLDWAAYKVHFARSNGEHQPLDVWIRNRNEWLEWQEYRPKNNDFNRPRIFSLVSFYHEPDTWLFTGILKVKERLPDRYVVEVTNELESFIGRLKISCSYKDRQTRPKLEGLSASMTVKEVIADPYTGRRFPGFENIDVTFEKLESLIRQGRSDWQSPLSSVHGVYLITDTKVGQRYVGVAAGAGGVWSRWDGYITSGHGGNVGLQPIVDAGGLEYCRRNFRFTLLEHRPASTSADVMYARENHWKRILFSRREMNRN